MVTDTIADFLARVQNAILRKRENVVLPSTKMVLSIVSILKKENLIEGFEVVDGNINIVLKYDDKGSVITKLIRVSKPGQRIYVTAKEILPIMNGRGISIVSTSKGIMAGAVAKSQSIGGELICEIW